MDLNAISNGSAVMPTLRRLDGDIPYGAQKETSSDITPECTTTNKVPSSQVDTWYDEPLFINNDDFNHFNKLSQIPDN